MISIRPTQDVESSRFPQENRGNPPCSALKPFPCRANSDPYDSPLPGASDGSHRDTAPSDPYQRTTELLPDRLGLDSLGATLFVRLSHNYSRPFLIRPDIPPPMAHPPWHPWYSKAAWTKRALYQLRTNPFCAMCLARGVPEAATVADHVTPHQGDAMAFWCGDLQSLCYSCHNSRKRMEELQYQGR